MDYEQIDRWMMDGRTARRMDGAVNDQHRCFDYSFSHELTAYFFHLNRTTAFIIVLKQHKCPIQGSLKPTDFICLTLMQVISPRSRRPPRPPPGGIKWIRMKGVD